MKNNLLLVLPDWTKYLSNDKSLNAKDLCEMLGIACGSVHQRVNNGTFPKADGELEPMYRHTAALKNKKTWSLGLLRKFVKTQEGEIKENV